MFDSLHDPSYELPVKKQPDFNPYTDNGGSIAGVGGNGFAIIAADTRLKTGYSIYSRTQSKITKLNKTTVFGSVGCWCDCLTFTKGLETRLKYYQYENNKPISTTAMAQLVSNMLYGKRFFPYYISNMVCGLDKDNQGIVYSYDPVGSTEQHKYRAQGTAAALLQPFLDCQLKMGNQTIIEEEMKTVTKERALKLLKDAFLAATEREINTGDSLQLVTVTPEGIEEEYFELRKD